MNVYQLSGSEDGTIAVFGSATRAVQHALRYVGKRVSKEDTLAVLHELKVQGFIVTIYADDLATNATVTRWPTS